MSNLQFGFIILVIGMTVVMLTLIVLWLFTHLMAKIVNPQSFEALKKAHHKTEDYTGTTKTEKANYDTELIAILIAAIASYTAKRADQIKLVSIDKD